MNRPLSRVLFASMFAPLCIFAQPYMISTVAGTDRLLDGHPAATVPLRGPTSVAFDPAGNLYIADTFDHRIRKVDTSGTITTYAGTGVPGYNGDRILAKNAELYYPSSLAFDAKGNLYIADSYNFLVRIVTPDGIINTFAGNGLPGGKGDQGPATQAQVEALAVATDNQGNVYISTYDYHIRKVDSNGTITTICGTGIDNYAGDNAPAVNASIGLIVAMVADPQGQLYLADYENGYVRKIDAKGIIHPVAGSGQYGYPVDEIPASLSLMLPDGLAVDSARSLLYISDADFYLNEIRFVDLSTGLIHAAAGNGIPGFLDGVPALKGELSAPAGIAMDANGNIFVADFGNYRVRKVTKAAPSIISTVAGTSNGDGGPATSAFLNDPQGVAVDGSSNVVVADFGAFEARRFMAGGSIGPFGKLMGQPSAVAADAAGNFYIADSEPYVLKVTPAGVTLIVAGNGQSGDTGDNGPATSGRINQPTGLAVDSNNNLYLADFTDNIIRKVDGTSGKITTIAGNGDFTAAGDNGPALNAAFTPQDVAVDGQGNLYIADQMNNRIRKIDTNGMISTVAGTGDAGYAGDGGPAMAAQLNGPTAVAVDSKGNLYIGDDLNNVVRRVTPNGLITTIAGMPDGFSPPTGDGGIATAAQLNPYKLSVDPAGNIYVSDNLNDRVRKLTPVAVTLHSLGIVSGDKQSATVGAQLSDPLVLKVSDSSGAGIPGVEVDFSITPAGAATISPSPALTLNDGTVSATVLLSDTVGDFKITASAGTLPPVTFSLTSKPAVSPTAPVISDGGIVSGGLSGPPITVVSSNGIASIFGDKFAPAGTSHQVSQEDLVNGKIPTNLLGACALFGAQMAPILGVYEKQLNVQVPQLLAGPVAVQVVTKCGTQDAETSNAVNVTVQDAAPEFFYFAHSGDGKDPIAAINAVSLGPIGASGLVDAATPAKRGDLLTLFATGFGATDPSFDPGVLPDKAAQVTAPYSIKFGGVTLASTDILYVGVTQNAGLYQVNIRVPNGVKDGDQPLTITIGGSPSPSGPFITVKGDAAAAIRP